MIELGRLRLAKMVSEMEVSMKMMAHQVVSRERAVAVPRGPNAVWLPMPPKVAAISALLPCCSSTTTINTAQTNTSTTAIKATINISLRHPLGETMWCGTWDLNAHDFQRQP